MVVTYTYGRHSWDFQPPSLDGFALVAAVRATFTVTAIVWTKTAFAVTLLRLADGWMKKALWFIIFSMNIAMGLSALFFWITCTPLEKAWRPSLLEGSCWDPKIALNYGIFSGGESPLSKALQSLLSSGADPSDHSLLGCHGLCPGHATMEAAS